MATTRSQAAPTFDTVLYEKKGPICHITLNRPQKLNAANDQLVEEVNDALFEFDADPELQVAILAGAGRAFCSGSVVNIRHPPPSLPRCVASVPMTSAPRPARCSHAGAVGTARHNGSRTLGSAAAEGRRRDEVGLPSHGSPPASASHGSGFNAVAPDRRDGGWMSIATPASTRRPPGRRLRLRRGTNGSANLDLLSHEDHHEILADLHGSGVHLSRRWYQILLGRVGHDDV